MGRDVDLQRLSYITIVRVMQRRAKLEPATFIVSMSNRSCRFADWGGFATNAIVLLATGGS